MKRTVPTTSNSRDRLLNRLVTITTSRNQPANTPIGARK
jgi:hypothetical protein